MKSTVWLLGLELTRFAPSDGANTVVGGSLDVVEAGGFSLAPYAGPALQPYLGMRAGWFQVELAPGAAWRSDTLSGTGGREAQLQVFQWRTELRLRYTQDRWFTGVDAGMSGGRAHIEGTTVAEAAGTTSVGPTFGLRAPLAKTLDLSGRVRWLVAASPGSLQHGPGGAVALEWRP